MTRRQWWLGTILVAAGVIASCNDWPAWDDLFKRTAAGTRGWTGGDGVVGIPLPGSTTRTLWIFGDTYLSGWDSSTGTRTNNATLYGNTIALQSPSTSSPTTMDFYARNANGTAANINANITGTYNSFFSHQWFGLTQPANTVLWPSGAECLRCDDGDSTNDVVVLGMDEVIPAALASTDAVIATISNPTAAPSSWTVGSKVRTSSVGMSSDIAWGVDFLYDGAPNNDVYIYGRVISTKNLVVARTSVQNLTNPSQWSYKKTTGWATGTPSVSQLAIVAKYAGALDTVDKVTRRGITQYVLTHDHAFDDHYIFLRTSSTPDHFDDIDVNTPRLDLTSIDSSLEYVSFWEWYDSTKTGCYQATYLSGVADHRKCGVSYHSIAHPHISVTDSFGISQLVFTYIIPHGLGGTDPAPVDYYRPKFGFVPLDNLPAWCGAAGAACWHGIANQFYTRTLNSGDTRTWSFDVTKARGTTFTAHVTGGSGDPDLYLRWNAPPTTTAYDCRPYTSGWDEDCSSTVPANASSAYVMVRGYSSTSTFTLQTNHLGD